MPTRYAVGKPMVCLSSIRQCRERFETMSKMHDSRTIKACKAWLALCDSGVNLKDSTVEDAVVSFRKLVEVAEGYENLCNTNEDFIKALLKTIADQGVMIDNLRKDLDGMGREVDLEKYKNKILSEMVDEQDGMVREKNNV